MYDFLIILLLLVVLVFTKRIITNWLNPGYILFLYWSFFIISALVVFRKSYNWQYEGIVWLIISILTLLSGSILSSKYVKSRIHYTQQVSIFDMKVSYLNKNSWRILFFLIIIGILRTFIEVGVNGLSLQIFLNFDSLLEANSLMAQQRYDGNTKNNFMMRFMLVFVYAAPLCGGYSFTYSDNKKKKLLSLLTLLPIILSMLLTNGKAGVLASVFLWLSGFLVSYLEKNKKAPSIESKSIIKIILLCLSLFGVLFFSMLLRVGDFSRNTLVVIYNKFVTYSLGHVPAFDNWFYREDSFTDYFLGNYTFNSILSLLGFPTLDQGVHSEILMFGNGTYSNIYTMFRGLITDYGIIGSILFCLISGIFFGYIFQLVVSIEKPTSLVKVLLSSFFFFIFYSFIVSSWIYTSYLLAFFVFWLYLKLGSKERIIKN